MVNTIEWIERVPSPLVRILDQTILPQRIEYVDCDHYTQVVQCIKQLSIRGAPAIGIAAAMGIALAGCAIDARDGEEFAAKLSPVLDDFIGSRPTAVNIRWAVERVLSVLSDQKGVSVQALKDSLVNEARGMLTEDIEINKAIGRWGAQFIKDGARVLTHCNAGSLATGGYGTATAPIRVAIEQGKRLSVIADETRPVLQGARLTSWELLQDGIDVTLITDNMAGALMKRGEIDLCIVGTDRTVRNGDVANKIGTYSVAVLAREHNIPFYVAAPISSIDFTMSHGDLIPIEERDGSEVTNVFGTCRIAPDGVKVRNIAFDVTPARLVTLIFTEKGAFRPQDIHLLDDPTCDIEKLRVSA
ncbi:MAG: S-methyl-5-thioribose-1-phosphate isomerase [Nitrospirae bacterium]|uniref:S-methyl-5-thioribose-1-phosphate isomerase n=1 Tax=Candidatus Magnetobacterium casense TaxID=1455061 RepID=UPI00069759CC|nr:S-methyl-5-thioribose-1-phosphate isomerase [Candidatus Magnetobacterium casensis]MBF0338575.1 S-methyl-5-thioribose-1-phosphate isomerase [Nitrospirota bacterium]